MKKPELKTLLLGVGLIIWLMSVFPAYMVTHKPFTPELLLELFAVAWRITLPLALTVLAGGIGSRLAAKPLEDLPPYTAAALAAGVGYGIISLYVLVWGITVGVNVSIIIAPFATAFLLRSSIARWLNLWRLSAPTEDRGWFSSFALASLSILAACQLLMALAPPLQFDALTYHFAIPQAYIQEGVIHYIPGLMFWGMPQLAEMLYALVMLAGGAQSAAVLSWIVGLLAMAGLWDFCHAHFGAASAWLAAGSLASGETLILSLGSGYVEWFSILYGLAVLAALWRWRENGSPVALGMAGLYAGLALSVKYTAGVALAGAGLAVLVFSGNFPAMLLNGLRLAVPALLVFSPWLVKNTLATGNPIYPLIIPTLDFDATRMAFYNFEPLTQDWSRLLLLPWLATVLGVEKTEGYSASIGPILLAFSPFAWLFWKQSTHPSTRRLLNLAVTLLLTVFVVWAVGSQFRGLLQQSRLYMVVFPAWAVLAAAGFSYIATLKAGTVRFGNVAAALAAMALVFATNETVVRTIQTDAAGAVLGSRSQEAYLERNLGAYVYALDEMSALPEGARVLMLWETRGFYCEPRCDSDEIIDRWFHDWRTTQEASATLSLWREQGYTHLLIRLDGMNFVRTEDKVAPYRPTDWQALDALREQLPVIWQLGEAYALYSIPGD